MTFVWTLAALTMLAQGCASTSMGPGGVAYDSSLQSLPQTSSNVSLGPMATLSSGPAHPSVASAGPEKTSPSGTDQSWQVRGQNQPYPNTGAGILTPGSNGLPRHHWASSGQPSMAGSHTARQSGSVPFGAVGNPAPVASPPFSPGFSASTTTVPTVNQIPPPPLPHSSIPTNPPAGSGYSTGPVMQSAPYLAPGQSFVGPQIMPTQPQPFAGMQPGIPADIEVIVDETQTGRFMFGVGINSDAGVIGNIVVDERNFDLFRPPSSWQDVVNGTAFRGGAQRFRLEALPGSRVQRYTISLTEPYLLGTQVSFNVSGYFFDRRYFDWDEQRLGGRAGFGYRVTPDLSVGMTLRAEEIDIHDLRIVGAAPELDAARGTHDLYSGRFSVSHDTRDIAFAPTEGHLLELAFEQVFGSFDYSRVTADYRQYFRVHQRPDESGRHVLGYSFRVGVSGSDTPVFENFFAGGYSTLRGFDFRGASPVVGGVIVGGEFQFLGSVEYMFPLTADDMLRGVGFVDFGTVERDIELNSENYRVAPGFGLRIFVPAMGPAPIALDFAFPVASAAFDDEQVFSFFIGFNR